MAVIERFLHGVADRGSSHPSTMLRMVPLPISDGEDKMLSPARPRTGSPAAR